MTVAHRARWTWPPTPLLLLGLPLGVVLSFVALRYSSGGVGLQCHRGWRPVRGHVIRLAGHVGCAVGQLSRPDGSSPSAMAGCRRGVRYRGRRWPRVLVCVRNCQPHSGRSGRRDLLSQWRAWLVALLAPALSHSPCPSGDVPDLLEKLKTA